MTFLISSQQLAPAHVHYVLFYNTDIFIVTGISPDIQVGTVYCDIWKGVEVKYVLLPSRWSTEGFLVGQHFSQLQQTKAVSCWVSMVYS